MGFQVFPVPGPGAEDVAVATDGRDEGAVYTGTGDGCVFRVSHDGRRIDRVAHTSGRPLGIEIDVDGRLLVCDSHRGLLRVDPATGSVEGVTDSVGGRRMAFCNNAAVASDGTVWFSDSSTKFGLEKWKADFVQDTRTGRLLRLRPDGAIDVVLDGLAFANGVALSRGEDFVAVAETATRTVVRHWLTGDRVVRTRLPRQDLPGYPDNIARGSDGLIWVAIGQPPDPFGGAAAVRAELATPSGDEDPGVAAAEAEATVRVQAYDDTGRSSATATWLGRAPVATTW